MLTYPSDPLPQIVCPMDEDAIPPNRFCSTLPHNEHPTPLLPFSSITPSCGNDGISGHRRGVRIQGIKAPTLKKQCNTDSQATAKLSRQNPSPLERQRENESMVQLSLSQQSSVKRTHGHEKQNKDRVDVILSAECQKKQRDQNTQCKKSNIPAAENVDELMSENSTDNFDTTKADMDTCGRLAVGHAVENASAPKGWEIGPLFQSFKSKMASFTEIVMSPVKLFSAYSPPPTTDHPGKLNECELLADATSGAEHSKPSNTFYSEAQSENVNQDVGASPQTLREVEHKQDAKKFGINYSKRLAFDEELSACSSEHTDECAKTLKEENTPDSVPVQLSPSRCIVSEDILEAVESVFKSSILLQPSAYLSASQESQLNSSSTKEEQKGELAARLKPLRRKCTGNRKKITSDTPISEVKKKDSELAVIDEQLSLMDSVKLNNASDFDKTQSLSSLVSCTQQSDYDYRRKMKSGHLVRQSLRSNLRDTANGSTLTPKLVTPQLESQMKHLQPTGYSSAGVGRAKREQNLDCHSQGFVKRKRLTVDVCKIDSKQQDFCNEASERDVLRGLRTPRKEDVLTNTVVDGEEMLRPVKRRQLVSLRTNKEQKQEILTRLNKAVLNPQTDNSCEAMFICSLDKINIVSEDNQKGRSKVKPSGSCKRQKMRTVLGNPNVNIDNMDPETTIEITSTKQSKEAHLSGVLVCPDIRQLHSTRKCKGMKKLLKRKSPKQMSSPTESDYSVDSTPPEPSVEPLEEKFIDSNTSQLAQKEEYRNFGPNQLSKRSKKGLRSAVKSSAAGERPETDPYNQHLITKENLSQKDRQNSRIPMDRIYFEMTSFESKRQSSSSSQPHLDFPMQLDDINRKERDAACMEGEACPTEFSNNIINTSRLRSCARRVNIKPRQAENQRRKCRVLRCGTRNGAEVVKKSAIVDNADLATSGTHLSEKTSSRSLLRSYSCPEILSLHSSDVSWRSTHSPHHSRIHTSYQHQVSHSPFSQHTHKSLRRARRHTVCSVEVEREIAPLCLRKEVYPSRRSVPYDGTSQILSPNLSHSLSSSLSSLATCFLSSPLAFLSKKVDSIGTAASTSTSSHVSSPTSSSSLSLSPWHRPRFQGTDSSNAAFGLSSSVIPLECEIKRRQSEEDDDGENTSSSSQDFEDVVLREEKALSDSEIKVVQKLEERGKVSSIRIRKTLPKPQYSLTPMGLPKPIRLKKKEFSLEEIYTNKNFNKPPESRLETIFEVPLNRRNGSDSWFGQRRLKRFMEFLEVGEARKPKKLLVGVGKAGMSSSRTRRGGFAKEEPSFSGQDVDSLLCAKLDQLNLWLMHDHRDS